MRDARDAKGPRQREIARFLLGFGIGLVLGIVFHPGDHSRGLRGDDQFRIGVRTRIQAE